MGNQMYQFESDAANNILRGRFVGLVNDQELLMFYRSAGQEAARIEPSALITDFSEVTSFEVSPATVRQLAQSAPAVPDPEIPRIIIAPSGDIFGLSRIFKLHGEETRPNLHIVRAAAEAWEILRIKEPRFERI